MTVGLSTSPLPIVHHIPWRCEQCGEGGTITLTCSEQGQRAWTREERLTDLFWATVDIHRSCHIINVMWEWPESWTNEVFQ